MGQMPSRESFETAILNNLIDIDIIKKPITRHAKDEYFDEDGYPIDSNPEQPIWFTDETGINIYTRDPRRQNNHKTQSYTFNEYTGYKLINMTNTNDHTILNNTYGSDTNVWLNRDLMKQLVDYLIDKLKSTGEMRAGVVLTKIRDKSITITEEDLRAIYNTRTTNTSLEIYLFSKLFEEIEEMNRKRNNMKIIGFYNGNSAQDFDTLPLEFIILNKYVRSSITPIRYENISKKRKTRRGGRSKKRIKIPRNKHKHKY
jgi:hypothetical protein